MKDEGETEVLRSTGEMAEKSGLLKTIDGTENKSSQFNNALKDGPNKNPILLQKLEAFAIGGMCLGLVIGVVIGIPYILTNDASLRVSIYSLSGKLFWNNFYVLLCTSGPLHSKVIRVEFPECCA